ncbi:MAG: amidohydrolase family protein [Candidatus Ranarchaeia archaeon]
MTDILIKNGVILTQDRRSTIIQDGAVAIEGNRIVAVGKTVDVLRGYPHADYEIDATNQAILPGFVNTHGHTYQNLLKGGPAKWDLMNWISRELVSFGQVRQKHFLMDDWKGDRYASLLASLEALRTGTTTIVGMDSLYPEILEGFQKANIRAFLAGVIVDTNPWVPENFCEVKREWDWKVFNGLVKKYHNTCDGRIKIMPAPTTPWLCSETLIRQCIEKADELGTHWTIHVSEVKSEVTQIRDKYGNPPLKYLDSLGVLDHRTLAVHCVWLTPEEMRIAAERGIHVSHNPESNMKLASGIMPFGVLKELGVNICLATDGAASNDNLGMIESMRFAAMLTRVHTLTADVISARDLLRMATINGARALGIEKEVGSIETDKKADICVLNLRTPNNWPVRDIENTIVFSAYDTDITHTICDGKLLVADSQILHHDMDKIYDEADKAAQQYWAEQNELREHPLTPEEYEALLRKVAEKLGAPIPFSSK